MRSWLPLALFAGLALEARAAPALAWGATGHRLIGRAAAAAFPADLPPFLHTAVAVEALGELAREPDRSKDAGRPHDRDRDPDHFVDVEDDGRVLGGPLLSALPPTREAYDSALRVAGADGWRAGWLPYAIVDGAQQLAKDFAYWRVETAAVSRQSDPARRAWLSADLARREQLILADLGPLAHFVGDGSQPLHVTQHFDGWGEGPNPEHFTTGHVHAPFEGEFVHEQVGEAAVIAAMAPAAEVGPDLPGWTQAYLGRTAASVIPFYRMEKAGGLSSNPAAGRAFAVERLAAGASALRDVVVWAWAASLHGSVGWPEVRVADVLAGKADPFDALFGED